jgi:hypothetical protein
VEAGLFAFFTGSRGALPAEPVAVHVFHRIPSERVGLRIFHRVPAERVAVGVFHRLPAEPGALHAFHRVPRSAWPFAFFTGFGRSSWPFVLVPGFARSSWPFMFVSGFPRARSRSHYSHNPGSSWFQGFYGAQLAPASSSSAIYIYHLVQPFKNRSLNAQDHFDRFAKIFLSCRCSTLESQLPSHPNFG